MHADHDDEVAVSTKKKHDKTDTPPDVLVRVEKPDTGLDKKVESKDSKPRIVLTFRSEKSGAKNSNMKIVSTEEKHEEFSPRRLNKTRFSKWESDEENETLMPSKKDLSVSQPVSDNDETSDSPHTTPKRSARRRSKEFSDNILANAIARKEKSYNETLSGPTQRLSRRIKPTAKILANEELRMGLESQNNARLGKLPHRSSEGGVVTRRQYYKRHDGNVSGKKGVKRRRPVSEETKVSETVETGAPSTSDMKAKHLCKLGLKAIKNAADDEESQEHENRDAESDDYDPEMVEDEDEEMDDDTEVISKLLQADEDSSDEDFYCPVDSSQSDRPRRSTRLCSSYETNDSDQSSTTQGEDDSKVPPRRSSRLRFSGSDFYDRNATGPEEGEEAAYPLDNYPIVAKCLCEDSSNIHAAPDDLTEPVFCQAIETVDGVRVGCSHPADRLADGSLAALHRAGPRAPYFLACRLHAAQLIKHMCCAACGLFCVQGVFCQCSQGHLFHIECGIFGAQERSNDAKQRPGCPHCGVHSEEWQPANRECHRVKIEMHCSNKRVYLPDQREQCTAAFIGFSAKKSAYTEHGPLIPKELLPSPPIDLKRLCETAINDDEEMTSSRMERLFKAVIAGETAELLIPKIVASKSDGVLDEAVGIAATHGRPTALYLLHFAGASLDKPDDAQRTPLMRAIGEMLDTSKTTSTDDTKETNEMNTEAMEVDKKEVNEDGKEDDKNEEKKEVKEDDEAEEIATNISKPSSDDLMKVIRYLVAAGCDVNLPGPDGMTSLHIAAQLGSEPVCKLLLDEGRARVDAQDHGGWSPLVWAAENKHSNVVRLLLEYGADAAATDAEGNAVVHWCALHGDARSLQLLLDAAPHAAAATNAHGDTPLHVAARQGHYACVVILLARGARTDIENSAGELAVEVCTGQCQTAISLNMQMALAVHEKPTRCRILTNDISNGREFHPVPCINEVDDTPLPEDFTYVTRHVMPEPVTVDCSIATLQGCTCKEGECGSGACPCSALCVRSWYCGGRLHPTFPFHDAPMLFECNETCSCNAKRCGNRVVSLAAERGSLGARVQVFRTERCGWGLRAAQPVLRGALAALYCGELLPQDGADLRPTDHYMFALDLKPDLLEQCADKSQLCVDAALYGGAARFINHSCRPNLAPLRVYTNCRDLRLPQVALFAMRDVQAGEELTFDYGDKFWSVKSKWMKCECRSSECRYPKKSTKS